MSLAISNLPRPPFNNNVTSYRRDIVVRLLSEMTDLEEEEIDDRINTSEADQFSKIFRQTGCFKVSEEYISYMAERSIWKKLLKKYDVSRNRRPWIFGGRPPVWEEGMTESRSYSEYCLEKLRAGRGRR